MASSAERWVIVGTNGKPIADIRGDVPVFTCREEAEHCLMLGETPRECRVSPNDRTLWFRTSLRPFVPAAIVSPATQVRPFRRSTASQQPWVTSLAPWCGHWGRRRSTVPDTPRTGIGSEPVATDTD